MRRKYGYFVNEKEVSRKEFILELEKCCQKVVYTDVINDCFSIDLCDLDKKKFNESMRDIAKGTIVMFLHKNKTFKRRVKE